MRVGFFGGTFDPVHQGHLEVATKARRALQLDKIVWLPCRRSPHKSTNPGASDEERARMLELATGELSWSQVNRYELSHPPPSYTWQTLEALTPAYPPSSQFFLLIGLDQWEALPRWQHPERLAHMVEFIVIGRDGHPSPRVGYRAHFLRGDHPASASEIRTALANKEDPAWLPEKVRTFITRNGLYQCGS